MSPSAATHEIPLILTNRSHLLPPPESKVLGTQNFTSPPKAIIFGAAFEDEHVAAVRSAIKDAVKAVSYTHLTLPTKRIV